MIKLAMLLMPNMEITEALGSRDYLLRAGIDVTLISPYSSCILQKIEIKADLIINDSCDFSHYDGLVIPGGSYVQALRKLKNKDYQTILSLIKKFNANNRLIAVICAAPLFLKDIDLLSAPFCGYPGIEELATNPLFTLSDSITSGNIITSKAVSTIIPFALSIFRYFKIDTANIINTTYINK